MYLKTTIATLAILSLTLPAAAGGRNGWNGYYHDYNGNGNGYYRNGNGNGNGNGYYRNGNGNGYHRYAGNGYGNGYNGNGYNGNGYYRNGNGNGNGNGYYDEDDYPLRNAGGYGYGPPPRYRGHGN